MRGCRLYDGVPLHPADPRRSTAASRALDERLGAVMPGGNTRTATWYAPYPVALAEGRGCRVTDVDGNEYLDFVNNYTSLVHGHAHPAVVEAIAAAAAGGTVFPAPLALQAELAERIVDRMPSIELVRFVNSGSEANMQAVRCARAVTGRSLVVKARGGYHGSWEQLPPVDRPEAGIPGPVLDLVAMVSYNDEAELSDLMERRGEEVAAIVLEPVLGSCIVPGSQRIPPLRQTPGRCARRAPDPGRGGHAPARARRHAGAPRGSGRTSRPSARSSVEACRWERSAARASTWSASILGIRSAFQHHGTFNGNACTMAAGVVTLDHLGGEEIARIGSLGARLSDGLRRLLTAHDMRGCVTQAGSLVQLHLDVANTPTRYEDTRPASPRLRDLHRAALEEGVYMAPRGELCVSTAMDDQVIDLALGRLDAALRALRSARLVA